MKKVVIVWELGADLGHINRLLPLADALRKSDCEVIFILRDLSRAQKTIGRYGYDLLQAPLWLPMSRTAPNPPRSYPEILLHYGYQSAHGLLGVLRAWRKLFDYIQPDLMVFDYAPTAMLAARGFSCPKATIGNGFFLPPKETPMPSFDDSGKISRDRLLKSEGQVLNTINVCMRNMNLNPLESFHHLFNVDEQFLCTLPELDHYRGRCGEEYWGCFDNNSNGIVPNWPSNERKRVFVYLKNGYRNKTALLDALAKCGAYALIFSPDISNSLVNRYDSKNLIFSREPYCIEATMSTCDLAICHAGHGTMAVAFSHNVPVLLAPLHTEQLIMAKNIKRLGRGEIIGPQHTSDDIEKQIEQLLRKSGGGDRVQDSFGCDSTQHTTSTVDRVANRCLQLLKC